MNKQFHMVNGVKVNNKIEWTDYTWNVIGGCKHACRWDMPDGSTAICYAEEVANKLRDSKFYAQGFSYHYWHPNRLAEPLKLKTPSKIFLDSMSDLMGAWVPDEQINAVLDVARQAHWHTFQLLTKNHKRLLEFDFPDNVWVGVSAPPTHMNGRPLDLEQQHKFVVATLNTLSKVKAKVRWMSIEPLSFDIAEVFWDWRESVGIPTRLPLRWAVVGAATNGMKVYQPKPEWVCNVLEVLDADGAKVFFKGNLKGNAAANPWREEFPS